MHSFVFQRYTNRIKVPVWKKYQCYGVIFSPTVSSKSVFDVQVKPLSVALVCTLAGVVIAMASAVISPAEPLFAIDLHRTFQNPMKRRMTATMTQKVPQTTILYSRVVHCHIKLTYSKTKAIIMNKFLLLSSIAALLLHVMPAVVSGGAVELNPDNFDELTAGKNTFVKFFAPWCGHCKGMKPAWDQLADEFASSSSVLIADCDCTGDCEPLCSKHGVQGYPTIKSFMVGGDASGETYQSGRDYDSLKKHIVENLAALCNVETLDDCNDKEKEYIAKMKAATPEARAKQLSRLDKMKGDIMKSELKAWLMQRLAILKNMEKSKEEEL
jgi:protein disulfide-isomerase A6